MVGPIDPVSETTEMEPCPACAGRQWSGDSLTGLGDRREFLSCLGEMLSSPAPQPSACSASCSTVTPGRRVAVLILDLDRFKTVNDTLGHPAGDSLLQKVAGRLRSAVRESDMPARIGGDEFAVLLDRPVDERVAAGIAARLAELIARPYMIDGSVVNSGASIGIAFGEAGMRPDEVMRHADLALRKNRAEGGGSPTFFEPALQEAARARRALEVDLRAALPLGQFEVFYQPKLHLPLNRLSGFEALIRWRHPARGLVPPDSFIPLAEEIGLISRLGEWVLKTACAEASRWPGELSVAVNVAPAQFYTGTLVPSVTAALATSGLPGRRLELEVTETALLRNGAAVLQQLSALKDLGVKMALDDFGTGYSSLTQLRSFPFDRVKIDRSFADDPVVVRAVAALGASLGMGVTAEGVETAEQMRRLAEDGCTEAQGYYLGRPTPASELPRIIRQHHSVPDAGEKGS